MGCTLKAKLNPLLLKLFTMCSLAHHQIASSQTIRTLMKRLLSSSYSNSGPKKMLHTTVVEIIGMIYHIAYLNICQTQMVQASKLFALKIQKLVLVLQKEVFKKQVRPIGRRLETK